MIASTRQVWFHDEEVKNMCTARGKSMPILVEESCLLMPYGRHRASFDQVSEFNRGRIVTYSSVSQTDLYLALREWRHIQTRALQNARDLAALSTKKIQIHLTECFAIEPSSGEKLELAFIPSTQQKLADLVAKKSSSESA
ncbi:hypothetical protein TNCV_3366391 [Trichonephila clavipes]|nr:hypothetical protein TNCV_3366391 [Trichonephila clavipes]